MKREDVPIDPRTGLAVLPDDQFFRVVPQTDRHGNIRNYTMILIQREQEEEVVDGWFGPKVKKRVDEKQLYATYIAEYDGDTYIDTGATIKDSDVVRCSVDLILIAEEQQKLQEKYTSHAQRSYALVGDYPPKRIK